MLGLKLNHVSKRGNWRQFAKTEETPQPLITKISLKMAFLKFHTNLPGANELTTDEVRVLVKGAVG